MAHWKIHGRERYNYNVGEVGGKVQERAVQAPNCREYAVSG